MKDFVYEREIKRHIQKMERILDDYSTKIQSWQETDELAIQRAFQILIESIIGISRYYLSVQYNIHVNRSRESFDELKNRNVIKNNEYEELMKIIGFRNILVHDYLELEFKVLKSLMEQKSYKFLIQYYSKIVKKLDE